MLRAFGLSLFSEGIDESLDTAKPCDQKESFIRKLTPNVVRFFEASPRMSPASNPRDPVLAFDFVVAGVGIVDERTVEILQESNRSVTTATRRKVEGHTVTRDVDPHVASLRTFVSFDLDLIGVSTTCKTRAARISRRI
jgi:hypothetical protein